jgi:general secretion pathway protein A
MYHSYFGIEEQAFSIAVNPRYMYMSAQHREALAHLLYGVRSGGFVMLTGEVGTGKTTTIRCLLEQLPANADVAMVMNPAANARDLMCSICDEFGLTYDVDETNIKVLTDMLYAFLLKNHSDGRNSIVLIDEAQLLRISTLEQIRLLTNLESNTEKMLQIILVGQPELNELLAKPALRQLSQRITARYHLRPLSVDETAAYIRHRLMVAGMPPGRDPFPLNVVRKVHAISGGIPRLINILCDRMLLGAYTQDTSQVDRTICKQATEEVLGDPRERAFKRTSNLTQPLIYGGSAVLVSLILSTLIWLLVSQDAAIKPLPASTEVVAVVKEAPPPARNKVEPATPAVLPTPEPALPPLSDTWFRTQNLALVELAGYLGIDDEVIGYPCLFVEKKGLYCEKLEARTWDDFLLINRPAVLTLNTLSKRTAYAIIIAIEGDQAITLMDGKQLVVSLDDLGTLWTGEYVILWRRPSAFSQAIGVGSTGPLVNWLAKEFAQLDGQQKPLATGTFNRALEERVKLFQRKYLIDDDGLAGMQTLLRLGEALGNEIPLTKTVPSDATQVVEEN